MQTKKNHHYVPINHQVRWRDDSYKNKTIITLFDKSKSPYQGYASNPRDILCKKHLYSLFDGNEPPDPHLETSIFEDLDGSYAAAVNKVQPSGPSPLTGADVNAINKFIVASYYRNPTAIDEVRDDVTSALDVAMENFTGLDLSDISSLPKHTLDRLLKRDIPYILKNAIMITIAVELENGDMLRRLMGSTLLTVIPEETEFEFVTGDRPSIGIESHGGIISIMPITPNICVMAKPPHIEWSPIQDSDKLVCHINDLLVEKCDRYFISRPQNPYLSMKGFSPARRIRD